MRQALWGRCPRAFGAPPGYFGQDESRRRVEI
jgi:hypothetical protein